MGTASANFVLLNELTPLPDMNHNFFAKSLKNHLPEPADADIPTTILAHKFCTTGHCITKVGLSNVCTHDQDGNKAAELKFPFKVTFETANVSFSDEKPKSYEAFLDQFKNLTNGTKLYNIKAHQHPDDHKTQPRLRAHSAECQNL